MEMANLSDNFEYVHGFTFRANGLDYIVYYAYQMRDEHIPLQGKKIKLCINMEIANLSDNFK